MHLPFKISGQKEQIYILINQYYIIKRISKPWSEFLMIIVYWSQSGEKFYKIIFLKKICKTSQDVLDIITFYELERNAALRDVYAEFVEKGAATFKISRQKEQVYILVNQYLIIKRISKPWSEFYMIMVLLVSKWKEVL